MRDLSQMTQEKNKYVMLEMVWLLQKSLKSSYDARRTHRLSIQEIVFFYFHARRRKSAAFLQRRHKQNMMLTHQKRALARNRPIRIYQIRQLAKCDFSSNFFTVCNAIPESFYCFFYRSFIVHYAVGQRLFLVPCTATFSFKTFLTTKKE